jgi:hypothetical protein
MNESSVFDQMNDQQKEEYLKMQLNHLYELTSSGLNYATIIVGVAEVLEKAHSGAVKLSDDDMRALLRHLNESASQHRELISLRLEERRTFINSMHDKYKDE